MGYDNNSAPQIEGSIVAQIVTNDWWFGILGLSFEPVNYTDFGNPIPSYMALLRDRGDISSPSWSYTAGAFYRLKSVFGQLIFGGYDKSRFEENDVIFTMSGDNLRDILVTIRSISSTTEGGEATELMGEAEADFFYIDSSIPDLWLPVSVCEKFEEAFGIAWNESSNRYILSEDQHQSLKDLNPEITVTLANQKEGGTTTTITFPYLAFDHELSYPAYERPDNASTAESGGSLADSAPSDSVAYFPIRRAEDSSQYTLGRVFLQEAYITVDYNSRTFNVSQAVFLDPPSPNVLPVPPNLSQPANDTNDPTKTGPDGTESGTDGNGDSKSGGTKISGGIIAVIIVCAILGALLVVALIFLLCPCAFLPGFVLCGIAFGAARHQKKYEGHDDVKPVEIDGTRIGETAYGEQASAMKHELPDNVARAEIQGNPIMHPQELPAELPSALLKEHEATMRERSSTENPISSDETKVGAGHVSESSEGHSTDPVSSLSSGQRREHEERRLGRVAESDIVSPVSPNTEIWRRAHGQSGEDSPVVGWSSQSPRKGGMTSEGERE